MPEITLDAIELNDLQNALRRSDIEVPDADDIPTFEEYHEETGKDIEAYMHDVAKDKALLKLDQACPICGDPECDRGVAYVGPNPIHADEHPEAKAERAMDNRGRRTL
jgi:hypothetical protein